MEGGTSNSGSFVRGNEHEWNQRFLRTFLLGKSLADSLLLFFILLTCCLCLYTGTKSHSMFGLFLLRN